MTIRAVGDMKPNQNDLDINMKNTKIICNFCKGKKPEVNRCIPCQGTGKLDKKTSRMYKKFEK